MFPRMDEVFSNDVYRTISDISTRSNLNCMSISEVASKFRVTRQAVYVAIKNNRLKAIKQGGRYYMTDDDIKEYRDSLYTRKLSKHNGELIYPTGYLSVAEVAKKLKIPSQKIYYWMRVPKSPLKGEEIGSHYRFKESDIEAFLAKAPRGWRKKQIHMIMMG